MPSLYGLFLQRVLLVGFMCEKARFCCPLSLWSSWLPHTSSSLEGKLWMSGWGKDSPFSLGLLELALKPHNMMHDEKLYPNSHDSVNPQNKCGSETIRACLLLEHGLMRRQSVGPRYSAGSGGALGWERSRRSLVRLAAATALNLGCWFGRKSFWVFLCFL